MLPNNIPECLRGGEHNYVSGICTFCGQNMLSTTGWLRLRAKMCKCGACISSLADSCPSCKQPQEKTLASHINRFLLFVVEPFRIFLISPRPSGITILDQSILLAATTLGVCMSGYIRYDAANLSDMFKLKELLGALFVSLFIIPSLLKEPEFMARDTPLIYRIGLALQKGVFSDLVIQGVAKGLGA